MSVELLPPARVADVAEDVPHVLYRAFNGANLLLYVGISLSPAQRFAAHEREKPWWVDVAIIRLEHFPNRETAEVAEQIAIRVEQPVYNVAHKNVPAAPKPSVADQSAWATIRAIRFPSAEDDAIQAFADAETDGIFSQAVRRLTREGLRAHHAKAARTTGKRSTDT